MNSKPMIVVTGAGGTVGGAVVQELKRRGYAPREAFHTLAKAEKAKAEGSSAVVLDFNKPETLAPALKGAEAVFLLGTGGSGQIRAEINVVEAAVAAGVKRIVKLSVWDAAEERYGFAKIHRSVEKAIEDSGVAWTFLRPTGFMQNFLTHLGDSIRRAGTIYQPAANARISHIDVRDIARVAAEALTTDAHERKSYSLSGPQALTYSEAAEILSRVLDRKINYVAVPDAAAKTGLVSTGVPEEYADLVIDLYQYYRTGSVSAVSPAVKDVTGQAPVAFEQFVRDNLSGFRA
jgi:uncharacterized protein YbjT (DUF2867 family)